jgi:hypothetical protein
MLKLLYNILNKYYNFYESIIPQKQLACGAFKGVWLEFQAHAVLLALRNRKKVLII